MMGGIEGKFYLPELTRTFSEAGAAQSQILSLSAASYPPVAF